METREYSITETAYIIFNTSEIDKIDFSEVLADSAETVPVSVDGTRAMVGWVTTWVGDIAPSLEALSYKEGPYNVSEALEILGSSAWDHSQIGE